jgi:hypothetical protein
LKKFNDLDVNIDGQLDLGPWGQLINTMCVIDHMQIQANWSHLALSWVESWFSWITRLVLNKDEWARDLAQAWSFSYSIIGMGSCPWQLLLEGAMNSCGGPPPPPPPRPEFILNWKYLYWDGIIFVCVVCLNLSDE